MSKELSKRQIREIQLEILESIHSFCQDKSISYVLWAGSLIGAIRHNGYIPWDDDIDIAMPRPDFNRFMNEYRNRRFVANCITKDQEFCFTLGKVYDTQTTLIENKYYRSNIGVNVDIFPLDGLPDDNKKRVLHSKRIMRYKALIELKQMRFRKGRGIWKNLFLLVCKLILIPISYRKLTLNMNRLVCKYSFENCNIVANLAWGIGEKESIPKELIKDRDLKDFEGKQFYIPHNYDEVLRNRYGDYLVLPPESQRISHHGFKVYYK